MIRAFGSAVRGWYERVLYRHRIHQIAAHWAKQGVGSPYSIAAEEMYLRRKLEEFRDFASMRYLEDRTLTMDQLKDEWLKKVVKLMARLPETRDAAKALKAAIVSMPYSEVLAGEALKARRADMKAAITRAKFGNSAIARAS